MFCSGSRCATSRRTFSRGSRSRRLRCPAWACRPSGPAPCSSGSPGCPPASGPPAECGLMCVCGSISTSASSSWNSRSRSVSDMPPSLRPNPRNRTGRCPPPQPSKQREKIPPTGLEPVTCSLGNCCSIHLSYEGVWFVGSLSACLVARTGRMFFPRGARHACGFHYGSAWRRGKGRGKRGGPVYGTDGAAGNGLFKLIRGVPAPRRLSCPPPPREARPHEPPLPNASQLDLKLVDGG